MKAIISTESWERLRSPGLAMAQQVDAGEDEMLPDADHHLSFADTTQLFAELTPTRLALLEQLKALGKASIQTVAEHLPADQTAVRIQTAGLEQERIPDTESCHCHAAVAPIRAFTDDVNRGTARA